MKPVTPSSAANRQTALQFKTEGLGHEGPVGWASFLLFLGATVCLTHLSEGEPHVDNGGGALKTQLL